MDESQKRAKRSTIIVIEFLQRIFTLLTMNDKSKSVSMFQMFFLRRNACLCHYDTLYLGKTATYNYLHLSNPVTSIMGTTLETSVMSMKLQLDIQYTCHSLQLTPSRHREVTGIHSTGNKSKSKMYETDGHNFFPEATDAILNSM